MASLLFWSWIFIFISLTRPGLALPVNPSYGVLAKRALEAAFVPEFSHDNRTRTTFTAVVITVTVVIIAVIAGIILTIMRKRKRIEHPEALAGLIKQSDKPSPFKVENPQWWRNFRWQSSLTEDREHPDGSRVERLKAALGKAKGKPILPLHNDSNSLANAPVPLSGPQPHYPDILERPLKAPLFQPPQRPQSEDKKPTRTRPNHSSNRPQPRSPPKVVVTQGLSRSLVRADRRGLPMSPKAWRKSRRSSLRHPFVPSTVTDAPSVIAQPRTAGIDVPKTGFRPSPLRLLSTAESNLTVPAKSAPLLRPPRPDFDEKPRREVRFGSPQVRIVSPSF